MRKPGSCICENKGADQLCGNRTADQRLCFRYIASTTSLLSKSIILAAPVAEWVRTVAVFQRSKSFDHLTAVSGVGWSPALATCETSEVLLAGVSGGFPRVLPFRPTY